MASILVLTYNQELYIEACIESLLRQKTSYRFEIVIGEDYSQDQTLSICKAYALKYPDIIRLLPSESNMGMSLNNIRTINAARGKYLAYCDGDDLWTDPMKLQKQVDFLEENSDFGLVHTDGDYFWIASGKRINNYNRKTYPALTDLPKPFANIIDNSYNFINSSVVARRTLYVKILDEMKDDFLTYRIDDTFLMLEACQRSLIKYFDISMMQHNILAESFTQSACAEKLLDYKIRGYALIRFFIQKYPTPCNSRIKAIELYNRVILKFAFICCKKTTAASAYNQLKDYNVLNLRDRILYFSLKQPLVAWILRKYIYSFFKRIIRPF